MDNRGIEVHYGFLDNVILFSQKLVIICYLSELPIFLHISLDLLP